MSRPQPTPSATFSVGFRSIAVGCMLVAIASLATLVIVVSVRGTDLLSVVALALAVLAFAAQLIIYIVQASDSASATRRSLQLHSELSGLLAELRERTGNTQRSVDSINDRLLSAIIDKERTNGTAKDPEQFTRRVVEGYAEAAADRAPEASSRPGSTFSMMWPPPPPAQEAAPERRFMASWPTSTEVAEIRAVLESLPAHAQSRFLRYVRDYVSGIKDGATFGPGLYGPDTPLAEAGLIEKVEGWKLYTLTEKGRRVGRLFSASGEAPAWMSDLIELRDAIRERTLAGQQQVDNRDLHDGD